MVFLRWQMVAVALIMLLAKCRTKRTMSRKATGRRACSITPVYLSRVVRQVTGPTVVDYINQMLLMEASFLLQTSPLSITQIADRLHFADTPSFSKFFSRLKGMSPKEYRKG